VRSSALALRFALSLLTVLPVPAPAPTARVAAGALRWAPLVGVLLGAAGGGVLVGLSALDVPPLAAGLLTVGFLALVTRGMHVDGLADTADGLGCFGTPERALAVMRDGGAGPFAVVTLLVVLGAQAAALAELAGDGWRTVVAVALAAAVGRAGFGWVARHGVPAARPQGLGATVAESQPWWVPVAWWTGLAAIGLVVLEAEAAVGVASAAVIVVALSWHTRRRFGGMTGDVLGAANELATTATLLALATG
jgi:adenosylcobinamide-GDP ribazoletransferase